MPCVSEQVLRQLDSRKENPFVGDAKRRHPTEISSAVFIEIVNVRYAVFGGWLASFLLMRRYSSENPCVMMKAPD